MIKITHQVTSTNWEVEEEWEEGGGNICITHAYIYEPLQSKILVHKEKWHRTGMEILHQQNEDQKLQACCDSVTMTRGSTMKHMQLSQKNTAGGRDRSGASGPWITITRPRVDRICTCEGICGCAGEERETLCACCPIRYTRNSCCACFWTPPASLVYYQWSVLKPCTHFRF